VKKSVGPIIIGLMASALYGCAGSYRRPESIESKMARFQPHNNNPNKVPEIEVSPSLDVKSNPRRGPASVEAPVEVELPSNKRLYFVTLYGQYRTLSQFIEGEKAPELAHCPSFHNTLLGYKEGLPPAPKKLLSIGERYISLTPDKVATYPELSLPMTMDSTKPRLYDIVKGQPENAPKLISHALKLHMAKTYKELEELCDSGTSENYYNYENLTTHIRREGGAFSPGRSSLKSLLKTTVFSNMSIIKSLESTVKRGRMPASATGALLENYESGMIKSLGIEWSQAYFQKVGKSN